MDKLEFLGSDCRYPEDVERIVQICSKHGFEISHADAQLAWEDFSESMAAGWILLHEDDYEVFLVIKGRCAARKAAES